MSSQRSRCEALIPPQQLQKGRQFSRKNDSHGSKAGHSDGARAATDEDRYGVNSEPGRCERMRALTASTGISAAGGQAAVMFS